MLGKRTREESSRFDRIVDGMRPDGFIHSMFGTDEEMETVDIDDVFNDDTVEAAAARALVSLKPTLDVGARLDLLLEHLTHLHGLLNGTPKSRSFWRWCIGFHSTSLAELGLGCYSDSELHAAYAMRRV